MVCVSILLIDTVTVEFLVAEDVGCITVWLHGIAWWTVAESVIMHVWFHHHYVAAIVHVFLACCAVRRVTCQVTQNGGILILTGR